MKIAIVRQRYNPFGGAERFVERALGALVDKGAEVTLITRNWDGAVSQSFRRITCDPNYYRLLGGRTARDRSFAAAAKIEMARGGFDITQSHERIPGCMIFRAGDGVHAAWLEGRARMLNPVQRLVQRLSPYHRYVLGMEKAMFEHPALRAVICNSQMVADEISHFYSVDRSKLHVIYNGVDTEFFHPGLVGEFRQVTRTELGIPAAVPLLLHVGSGFERKGVPQLLEAFAKLQRMDVHLLIVGADRKLDAMRNFASRLGVGRRVCFTSGVQDVRPFYAAADAFVLNTLYDPCPNAVLEALACGLPVLTSNTCGAKELVTQGRNGWIVDALDGAALRHQLEALVSLAQMDGAREMARQQVIGLTLEAMAGRLLELYGRLTVQGGE